MNWAERQRARYDHSRIIERTTGLSSGLVRDEMEKNARAVLAIDRRTKRRARQSSRSTVERKGARNLTSYAFATQSCATSSVNPFFLSILASCFALNASDHGERYFLVAKRRDP